DAKRRDVLVAREFHRLLHRHAALPAAAASAMTSRRWPVTWAAGMFRSAPRNAASAATLSTPVTTNITQRARLIIGYVSVMRRGPWYGWVVPTSAKSACSTGSRGTSDSV